MNVGTLRYALQSAIDAGYGDYSVNFCDQDGDPITIDNYYEDNDGDVCLESNEYDNNDYTAEQLLSFLEDYNNGQYVYIYDDDCDQDFDIDETHGEDGHIWYIDKDGNLTIDTYYNND